MLRIPCEKCGKECGLEVDEQTGEIKLPSTGQIQFPKEIWLVQYKNDLCHSCREAERNEVKIEKRNKKIESIINKKWWQF